ncbi:membrane protein [Streptomyces sp. 150FB]|uniref:hypothetical protein n=1 Tax=Streptomyces sp. 150FB TaxID=1576605 RepID=UPI0005892152|nr:hypothetical protein [Streptomyces sp. 150FB]KIF77055.1 membrane protein [Streptomyces sp. 150FB]
MPLPFLTADRAFDATNDDVALPFDDHDRWRRPYRPGPWRVASAALLLLLASFILLCALVIALAASPGGAWVCLVLALVGIVVALRLLRVGAWVSRHGVRRVSLHKTTTERWGQITAVRTVQQPVRWLGLPRTVQGQALVVVRRRGGPLALLTDHNADFLSRDEAFERAADTVEAWGDEYRRP